MHMFRRVSIALVVGLMVIVGSAATAGAAPQGMPVTLHCEGHHYPVVTVGNGLFTPAHHVESHQVFIPVAFGDFTGTLTDLTADTEQVIIEEGTLHKGNAQARGRTIMHCTYTFMDQFIAEAGEEGLIAGHEYHFVGTGEVSLFVPGPRR